MKIKIKQFKLAKSDDKWESWFAWYPVFCQDGYIVWFDYVYRNWRMVRGLKPGRMDYMSKEGIPRYHGHWNYRIKAPTSGLIMYS